MHDEIHSDDLERHLRTPENRQLLERWRAAWHRCGAVPTLSHFNQNHFTVPDMAAVLERLADGEFRYVYFGRDLVRAIRTDLTGRRLDNLGRDVPDSVPSAYRMVAERMAPALAVCTAVRSHSVYSWERLILPVHDDRGPVLLAQSMPLVMRLDLLEAILHSGPSAMVAGTPVRSPDGAMVDLSLILGNRAAVHLFGWDDDRPYGIKLSSILVNLDELELMDFCNLVLSTGAASRLEADCIVGGRRGTYEIAISRFEGGVTLTFSDLGELRSAYNALEQQKTELVIANRALEAQKAELAALAEEMRAARRALDEEMAQRVALEGELRRLASVDDLTGAINRRAFMEILQREVARSVRYGHPLSVITLDVDHFKRINDAYGHAVGDDVLRQVAGALVAAVRTGVDEVARVGGEEFAVILPETHMEGACILADRLRGLLAEIEIDGSDPSLITASFGIATWDNRFETIETWLAGADAALYRAKQGGRDRIEMAALPPAASQSRAA
ncbi:hypothetical protein C2U72_13875 [Prosthecomicrobium hirschii]|uniref:diguanylate cyclase n=1 Tax=Prosthecodimorpha hirschii TaxID=665126 RepID=UPI001126E85B|nr:diguanylate cyclase [Prosthecomicrobium hirschii]TPQ50341.1 hypothetical protein C2U72_13875 [Prosthecomicrobium hirschii]